MRALLVSALLTLAAGGPAFAQDKPINTVADCAQFKGAQDRQGCIDSFAVTDADAVAADAADETSGGGASADDAAKAPDAAPAPSGGTPPK